jgi:Putative restriction endonuclease
MKLASLRLISMTSSPLAKATQPSVAKRNPTIEDFHFPDGLPTAADLPFSDDQPVDSILQELLPGLLKAILIELWQERTDWLFGIDLGFYYRPDTPAILDETAEPNAPDGMLCLGIKEDLSENFRPSYVLWQEKVLPIFTVEIVSKTPGGERTKKMDIYESMGILYYLVYAPLLKKKARFQLYKLVKGKYILQSDGKQPYWMPEVGLGIGVERIRYVGGEREWLLWYNEQGVRYPTPTELVAIEQQRAEAEKQKAEGERQRAELAEQDNRALRQRLRELGIDPDSL